MKSFKKHKVEFNSKTVLSLVDPFRDNPKLLTQNLIHHLIFISLLVLSSGCNDLGIRKLRFVIIAHLHFEVNPDIYIFKWVGRGADTLSTVKHNVEMKGTMVIFHWCIYNKVWTNVNIQGLRKKPNYLNLSS